jgi:hypothetical protein
MFYLLKVKTHSRKIKVFDAKLLDDDGGKMK